MSEQRTSPSCPPQGPVSGLLSLAGRITGLVISALLLRIVLELAGLYLWWPQEGLRHVYQVMIQEQTALMRALQPHPRGNAILAVSEQGIRRVSAVCHQINRPRLRIPVTLVAFILTSVMLRLTWLAIMLPLFCLSVLTGLTEGLVQRDLRRFGSGLESIFIHRLVIRTARPIAVTLWACYLAEPLFIPAPWMLLPAALWIGITVCMAARTFKRWV